MIARIFVWLLVILLSPPLVADHSGRIREVDFNEPNSGGWVKIGEPTIAVAEPDADCGYQSWSVTKSDFGYQHVSARVRVKPRRHRDDDVWFRMFLRSGDKQEESSRMNLVLSNLQTGDLVVSSGRKLRGPGRVLVEPHASGGNVLLVDGLDSESWTEIEASSSEGVSALTLYPGGLTYQSDRASLQVFRSRVQVGPEFENEENLLLCPNTPDANVWQKGVDLAIEKGFLDPSGGNEAWLMKRTGWSSPSIIQRATATEDGRIYYSVWIKAGSGSEGDIAVITPGGPFITSPEFRILSGPGSVSVFTLSAVVSGLSTTQWTEVEGTFPGEVSEDDVGVTIPMTLQPGGLFSPSTDASVFVFNPSIHIEDSRRSYSPRFGERGER